jgi:hypothetical protein
MREHESRSWPQCGGAIFEYATYVDNFHVDGDWYEYEITSCIQCQHIRYKHIIHCSEHGGFNDHYDGVKREVGIINDQNRWISVELLDRQYNSAVPDSDGYWPAKHQRLFTPREKVRDPVPDLVDSGASSKILIANGEVRRYLAKHPDHVFSLSSRNFEILVADVLKGLGFDVELTRATRDGGFDIYAYIRNEVCAFLMLVECKRWAADRPVGIEVVQRLYGIQQVNNANKSMIVTTSYFTAPAIAESRRYEHLMELKDYQDLKTWLQRFR